ncbi:hypothetical protein [Methyloceanibacter marginalis]|uniref:hypothetical protein n=1 Tax=Methyloceanibacter marginalis TaxID=1774971 RepID=UPI00114CD49E|nr:hypothetical protein [Methyloceanibacter marginalis]
MTYAELAADYCFIEREPVDAKSRLFNSKFVQLRHGMRTSTVFANGNGNTGKRGAGVTFQWYSDRPCKLTGEAECFHLEARIQGSRACKRHGITASTIASFDLAAWWDRQWAENKIGLYQIDAERFGRGSITAANANGVGIRSLSAASITRMRGAGPWQKEF